VGIEAMSRGAAMVHFVESSDRAAQLIKQNLASLGITTGFQILKQDSIRALRGLESSNKVVDFVFLDPPYDLEKAYVHTLSWLAQSALLKPETIVIAEHPKKLDPGQDFAPLHRYRQLVQGDAVLSFYRKAQ
jgi:16S rRNA (guanine(966)-N(2))-methyltransferase RsmD